MGGFTDYGMEDAIEEYNKGAVSCKCGWTGKRGELVKKVCVTDADEWYECPSCGGDSSKWNTTK